MQVPSCGQGCASVPTPGHPPTCPPTRTGREEIGRPGPGKAQARLHPSALASPAPLPPAHPSLAVTPWVPPPLLGPSRNRACSDLGGPFPGAVWAQASCLLRALAAELPTVGSETPGPPGAPPGKGSCGQVLGAVREVRGPSCPAQGWSRPGHGLWARRWLCLVHLAFPRLWDPHGQCVGPCPRHVLLGKRQPHVAQ